MRLFRGSVCILSLILRQPSVSSVGAVTKTTSAFYSGNIHSASRMFSCSSSSPSPSISRFLEEHVKPALHNFGTLETSPTCKLYIGNEASDADSIISALCCAYASYIKVGSKGEVHIPLVSVGRDDIILRRDVEVILGMAGISLSQLVSIEDLPRSWFSQFKDIHITLVDHNSATPKLTAALDGFPWNVVKIVDHHQDLGKHHNCCGEQRIIAFDNETCRATAGSTCSLIYELLDWTENHADVAILLLSVILLDTFSLDPKFRKNRPRDDAAIQSLADKSKIDATNHPALFMQLSNAKFDRAFWTNLTAASCMRYDYKVFDAQAALSERCFQIGISSILLPASEFLEDKDDALSAIQSAFKNVDVVVIMSIVTEPAVERQLIMVHSTSEEKELFLSYASKDNKVNLGLEIISKPVLEAEFKNKGLFLSVFNQTNALASRKQVAPYLIEFYTTHASA